MVRSRQMRTDVTLKIEACVTLRIQQACVQCRIGNIIYWSCPPVVSTVYTYNLLFSFISKAPFGEI